MKCSADRCSVEFAYEAYALEVRPLTGETGFPRLSSAALGRLLRLLSLFYLSLLVSSRFDSLLYAPSQA